MNDDILRKAVAKLNVSVNTRSHVTLTPSEAHNLVQALAASASAADEPLSLRDALEGIRAIASQAHRHPSNAGRADMFLAVIEKKATAALTIDTR